MTEERLGLMP